MCRRSTTLASLRSIMLASPILLMFVCKHALLVIAASFIAYVLVCLLRCNPSVSIDACLLTACGRHTLRSFLISQGVDVDAQTIDGNSIVWIAANNGCVKYTRVPFSHFLLVCMNCTLHMFAVIICPKYLQHNHTSQSFTIRNKGFKFSC